MSYGYDAVGNITTITDDATFPGYPQTQTFTYDALDRLLSAQAPGGPAGDYGPESYGYDPTTGSLASKAGVSYTYGGALHKHAVTAVSNGASFAYDANGNMITRSVGGQTFNLSYDAENRMTGVTGAATPNFVYDDTGARVIATEGVTTTVYVGSYFEWHGSISDTVKYYYAGTVRVAMRKGDGQALFLLGDHLGSTNRLVHADGTPVTPGGMRLYKAWGESRYEPDGELATEYRYTGQFEQQSIGLYYYGARWLDLHLSRFTSPDSLVSDFYNPLDLDRYQYVRSNPVKHKDPSGHMIACGTDGGNGCGGGIRSMAPLRKAREMQRQREESQKAADYIGLTIPTNSSTPTPWMMTPTPRNPLPMPKSPFTSTPTSTTTPTLTTVPTSTSTSTPTPGLSGSLPSTNTPGPSICHEIFGGPCTGFVDVIVDGYSLIPPDPNSGPGLVPPNLPETPYDHYLYIAASVLDLTKRISDSFDLYFSQGPSTYTPYPTSWPTSTQ